MSVNPGFGGQSFIEEVLPKVAAIRKMIEASGRKIDLEIDGGIAPDTVEASGSRRCSRARCRQRDLHEARLPRGDHRAPHRRRKRTHTFMMYAKCMYFLAVFPAFFRDFLQLRAAAGEHPAEATAPHTATVTVATIDHPATADTAGNAKRGSTHRAHAEKSFASARAPNQRRRCPEKFWSASSSRACVYIDKEVPEDRDRERGARPANVRIRTHENSTTRRDVQAARSAARRLLRARRQDDVHGKRSRRRLGKGDARARARSFAARSVLGFGIRSNVARPRRHLGIAIVPCRR